MIRRAVRLTRRGFFRLALGLAAAGLIDRSPAPAQTAAPPTTPPAAPRKPFFDDGTDFIE